MTYFLLGLVGVLLGFILGVRYGRNQLLELLDQALKKRINDVSKQPHLCHDARCPGFSKHDCHNLDCGRKEETRQPKATTNTCPLCQAPPGYPCWAERHAAKTWPFPKPTGAGNFNFDWPFKLVPPPKKEKKDDEDNGE